MSDLIERLRSYNSQDADHIEAADHIERLQAMIDGAIEEACDTQPSWEWRCYLMAKQLGANFSEPTSRYGKEGELQARVDELEAALRGYVKATTGQESATVTFPMALEGEGK